MRRPDNRTARGKRRTQAERSEEMQHRLRQAAFEVVANGGLGALRIATVAKHAGVSQGAVLHHFQNKDEITLAAIEQALTLANQESSAWNLERGEPGEILSAMMDEFRGFFFSDRFWVAIGITVEFAKNDDFGSLLSSMVSKLRSPVYGQWEERLRAAGWDERRSSLLVRSASALVSGVAIRRLWAPPDDLSEQLYSDWHERALSHLADEGM